ncbi:MAG: 6-bladed beta-propeller [Phocaeicola sp.]|nr:6-bladed beta-propeller [Phocaeicola sp.]
MKKLLGIFIMMLLFACTPTDENKIPTLSVDLHSPAVSLEDLFSKVEIIPLETSDSCLLVSIDKIVNVDGLLYIFDGRRPALYVFDEKGTFVRQISRWGDGPGEHLLISDFIVDKKQQTIGLLSPNGYMGMYDLYGRFIRQDVLPVKPNYYAIAQFDTDRWVFWSCVREDEDGITIVGKDSLNTVSGFWRNDRILDMGSLNPFYEYNDNVYFTTAYQNIVYKLTEKGVYPVYCWDFGKDGIDDEMLQKYLSIENEGKRNDELIKDLSDGTLPFCMKFHRENDLYYYVSLQKGLGTANKNINVFYRKQDGSTFVFERLAEKLSINPLLLTEDYIVSKLNFDDYTYLRPFLSEQDYSKLLLREEDDNPCLVKYYFKKSI